MQDFSDSVCVKIDHQRAPTWHAGNSEASEDEEEGEYEVEAVLDVRLQHNAPRGEKGMPAKSTLYAFEICFVPAS